ncbi:MAG: phosphotransferase [Verrucomicrobia bacterium]|nr:phosphotransferase [Verrucomicrobiota bacterium]MCH8512878.1 phosphotransferase [Kiritimatiellia bacterium]
MSKNTLPFPRKLILLAAGYGSRLRPLTQHLPKPLIPHGGIPLIARLMQHFSKNGVTDVLINVHHLAAVMLREVPGLVPSGMRVNFSHEPMILGTGGALRRMAWFFDDNPLWVCNADIVMDLNLKPLIEAFQRERPLAALWMLPDSGPKTVKLEGERIVDFRGGGVTFSGLHLMSPEILEFLPREEKFSSVITAYERGMDKGRQVLGIQVPGSRWADLGTPEQYLAANGGSSILWPGAQVDDGARVDQAIVVDGVRIRAGQTVTGMVVPPGWVLTGEEHGWMPEAEAVELLPARGSDRTFFRILGPGESAILMRSGQARPENHRFASHTRFLAKQGLRVPEIRKESHDRQTLLLEDLGRTHLLNQPTIANTRKALSLTAKLHKITTWQSLSLEPSFDANLYQWEHDLFFREFFKGTDPSFKGTDPFKIREALARAASRLSQEPMVLLHRDLQSTNFLIFGGELALIDYQGMRAGPAAYDLASLIADPYINRPPDLQWELLADYNNMAARAVSEAAYRAGVVQRMAQALGAFGRLGAMPATSRFLQHVPAAVAQIAAFADDPGLQSWSKEFLERQTHENPLGYSA